MLSTLERLPAVNETDEEAPGEITIGQLAEHLKTEFTHEQLTLLIVGIRGDEYWRITEKYHVTFRDLKAAIPKLSMLDAAGKDSATWTRPQRAVRIALPLQERLHKNLAARKIKISDPSAEAIVASSVRNFLNQSLESAKQAEAERRTPKPSPPPAPRTDMVGMAEQIISAAAAAEAAEQRAVKAALEDRYLRVIARFRNPSADDVSELSEAIREMPINGERVRSDIAIVEKADHYQAEYDRQMKWLRRLNGVRKIELRKLEPVSDAELLLNDDSSVAHDARAAKRELEKLSKQRPMLFNSKASPPTLRFSPASDE